MSLGDVELGDAAIPMFDSTRVAGIKLASLPLRIAVALRGWRRYFSVRRTSQRAIVAHAIMMETAHNYRRKAFAVPVINRLVVMPLRDGSIGEKWQAVAELYTVPWKCAYCDVPIVAEVGDLSAGNLCCAKCLSKYVSDEGPASCEDPIIRSSVDFTDRCADLLRGQRDYITKHAKENSRVHNALLRRGRNAARGKKVDRRQEGPDPLQRE